MPFHGDKGGAAYPEINRVRLISGSDYVQGAVSGEKLSVKKPVGQEVEGGKRSTWKSQGRADLSSSNAYGLTSRSEALFPEAYKPLDTKFWQPLSAEERIYLVMRQAQANLKATFQDRDDVATLSRTSADAGYADAQSRRQQTLKRRKPSNYDERKKEEERKKRETLQRRISGSGLLLRESSAIVRSGPIDTPILVSGLPGIAANRLKTTEPAARLRRRKRLARRMGLPEDGAPQEEKRAQHELPSFNPNSAPKAKLSRFTNSFGLTSRSEMLYPEAYRELSTIYWRTLSNEDRQQVMGVQARAMEKVGYERGTDKHFIEEIFPEDSYDYLKNRNARTDDTRPGMTLSVEYVMTLIVLLALIAVLAWYGLEIGNSLQDNPMLQPKNAAAEGQ